MLITALALTLSPIPVRAEPVEALPFFLEEKDSPSPGLDPGSGRTDGDMTPIEAERAFAADAKTIGQWTAFRKWSTDDAVMFVPQPVNAHEFLKDRKDPPKVIDWWPTASWISCDGSLAVNTGGWKRPDGSVGYFTTVWQRQNDGSWKWIVDGGDGLNTERPRPTLVSIKRADCSKSRYGDSVNTGTYRSSASRDGTLIWSYDVKLDGARSFRVGLWDGRDFINVIDDNIAGSPTNK